MHPVSFVGAGPGATDLLTLRAAERLRSADVLVWTDSLVCPGIPKLARHGSFALDNELSGYLRPPCYNDLVVEQYLRFQYILFRYELEFAKLY